MTCRTVGLALAVAALLGTSARAADETGSARDHFKKGQTHYALGEFNEAVNEFREAYRIKNEPAILFNIAQAMRQIGQFKQAYFYYSQYLHLRPEAANRTEVEGFMAAMKKKVDADDEADKARSEADAARPGPAKYPEDHLDDGQGQDDKPAKVAAGGSASSAGTVPAVALTQPSAVPVAALQPAPRAPLNKVHVAGYAALGAGVVAGGLAFLFHSGAQSAADQLNQKYASGTLTPADSQLKSDVASKGKLATLSAVGAGVLLATGALLVLAF